MPVNDIAFACFRLINGLAIIIQTTLASSQMHWLKGTERFDTNLLLREFLFFLLKVKFFIIYYPVPEFLKGLVFCIILRNRLLISKAIKMLITNSEKQRML